eukprot:SAG11_NODE_5347_length_1588_cov_2.326394_2_plen_155_part_00
MGVFFEQTMLGTILIVGVSAQQPSAHGSTSPTIGKTFGNGVAGFPLCHDPVNLGRYQSYSLSDASTVAETVLPELDLPGDPCEPHTLGRRNARCAAPFLGNRWRNQDRPHLGRVLSRWRDNRLHRLPGQLAVFLTRTNLTYFAMQSRPTDSAVR